MTTLPFRPHSQNSCSPSNVPDMLDSKEATLIRKLQSGDLDALGDLYDRYQNKTFQTALALTNDPAAAEDILQDCFLRLYRYANSIDPNRPLMPWLYRVTVNLFYDWVKRRKQWLTPLDFFQEKIINPQKQSPENQAEVSEVQDDIVRALGSIKSQHRTVIVLYYLNSLSTEEIAEILDCPVGTVKSRLYYGRENLRKNLRSAWNKTFDMKYEYA